MTSEEHLKAVATGLQLTGVVAGVFKLKQAIRDLRASRRELDSWKERPHGQA